MTPFICIQRLVTEKNGDFIIRPLQAWDFRGMEDFERSCLLLVACRVCLVTHQAARPARPALHPKQEGRAKE